MGRAAHHLRARTYGLTFPSHHVPTSNHGQPVRTHLFLLDIRAVFMALSHIPLAAITEAHLSSLVTSAAAESTRQPSSEHAPSPCP